MCVRNPSWLCSMTRNVFRKKEFIGQSIYQLCLKHCAKIFCRHNCSLKFYITRIALGKDLSLQGLMHRTILRISSIQLHNMAHSLLWVFSVISMCLLFYIKLHTSIKWNHLLQNVGEGAIWRHKKSLQAKRVLLLF